MATIGKGLETYLHRQATEVALNYLAEAREQAARIQEQAEVELLQVRRIHEQQSVRSNAQERRRSLAQARLAVSHQLALNNERALQQVWQRTESTLRTIISADIVIRCAVLEDLIADAADQLGGGALGLEVCAGDLALITPVFLEKVFNRIHETCNIASLHLNPQPVDIWGGVVVSRLESSQMVDNSFGTRLALIQKELRNQVFQLLDSAPVLE
ncbi:MAG: V-type ATP synthase subunit E [Anaerolineae bacterium]